LIDVAFVKNGSASVRALGPIQHGEAVVADGESLVAGLESLLEDHVTDD
jgi:hypothetical protein